MRITSIVAAVFIASCAYVKPGHTEQLIKCELVRETESGSLYRALFAALSYDGLGRSTDAGSQAFGDHWHRYIYGQPKVVEAGGVKEYANYHYEPHTNRLTLIEHSAGASNVGLG